MRQAKSKSRSSGIFYIATIVAAILLALCYITPYISVKTWGWLSLLALAYPFFLIINAAFAIGWFLRGRMATVIPLVVLLAGWSFHRSYFKLFSLPVTSKACEQSIRCTSYNVRGLSLVKVAEGGGHEKKIDTLYKALSKRNELPDIFAIQELSKGDAVANRFGLKHKYHAPNSTLWLFSRYPLNQTGYIQGTEKNPCALWADVKTPQGVLRVYNIHLASNRVTNTAEELLSDIDKSNRIKWQNVKFILSRYLRTTRQRAEEAADLQSHIASSPFPVMITGDMNDTPLSNTYHILSQNLNDAFRKRGYGLSTTYRSHLPLLRIDYILASTEIQFITYDTHIFPFSDHYPVSTGICFKQKGGS